MRLFIAEKPSLARSIATVLSKPQQNHKLYIQAGDDFVAWAAGHLLEQAMPEAYDDKYKHWNVADLPIFPIFGSCSSRKSARTYSTTSRAY